MSAYMSLDHLMEGSSDKWEIVDLIESTSSFDNLGDIYEKQDVSKEKTPTPAVMTKAKRTGLVPKGNLKPRKARGMPSKVASSLKKKDIPKEQTKVPKKSKLKGVEVLKSRKPRAVPKKVSSPGKKKGVPEDPKSTNLPKKLGQEVDCLTEGPKVVQIPKSQRPEKTASLAVPESLKVAKSSGKKGTKAERTLHRFHQYLDKHSAAEKMVAMKCGESEHAEVSRERLVTATERALRANTYLDAARRELDLASHKVALAARQLHLYNTCNRLAYGRE